MPAACKPFTEATHRWDRFERFLSGGADLSGADRAALLEDARRYSAGDLRAFGDISEIRRLRLERAIRLGARSDVAGRRQAEELFSRLSRYVRRAYQRDRDTGCASGGNVAEFLILEANSGDIPSYDYLRKVLRR